MKLSEEQWKRLDVVDRIWTGRLTVGEAATMLGISRRQVQRIKASIEVHGRESVLHGNRGRAPWNRASDEFRERVVELRRGKYDGFNDQHFTEKLREVEKLMTSRPTVRRWLRQAGIGAARKHRPPKHRRRRDRKLQAGMMILWDGSRHDWLEGRGPLLCLVGAIDDATGDLLPGAHFVDQECAAGYLRVLLEIGREKGLPLSAYMDQHGSLKRNDSYWTLEEELAGERVPTQVGRALKALGIEVIYALSPQAKGRVERLWGTLQDRLTLELRLAGATNKDEANVVLERFRPDHNRRFAVPPAEVTPAWRPVRKSTDLDRTCAFYYRATVRNDNTVRLHNRIIDIPPGPRERTYAKAKVEIRQLLDGSWRVYFEDKIIARAQATAVDELRAARAHRSSATQKAFRKAILDVAVSLP